MDIKALKDRLFERAKKEGFESCEIYYQSGSSFNVCVYKGNIEKYQSSENGGFCFRGLYKGNIGYYFSEDTDIDADKVVKSAKENAEAITIKDKEFIYGGDKEYPHVNVYNAALEDITAERKIQTALDIEKYAKEYDNRITVNKSMVASGDSYVYICNTEGLEVSERTNQILAYVEVMAEDKGDTKEKGEIWLGNDMNCFEPKKLSETACNKALSALGAESIKSGKMKTVIKNETFADIFQCFVGNFYAENVQKGFSLLKDKLGTDIASPVVSVKDDPLMEGGYMTTAFDSEGVASYKKTVVENGVLKTYLYNLKSANVDGVRSTGNGFKGSFRTAVGTAPTNFYIEKGSKSLDDVIEAIDYGIYINDVAGLHSGTNSISGDFSLAAEGFLIEKGKITKPVAQITIAGNFYEVLKNIDTVCSDLKFNSSAVGSPTVCVKSLEISGK